MADHEDEVEEVRSVLHTVDALDAMEDPVEQARRAGHLLAIWPQEQARLRQIRQKAVISLRAEKVSYRKIAAALGISLARVQQIEAGARGKKAKPPADE